MARQPKSALQRRDSQARLKAALDRRIRRFLKDAVPFLADEADRRAWGGKRAYFREANTLARRARVLDQALRHD